jgi:hypothetical protein
MRGKGRGGVRGGMEKTSKRSGELYVRSRGIYNKEKEELKP